MQINYTSDAFETLIQLVNFTETTNTTGAGLRWLKKYEAFLEKKLSNNTGIRLCNNAALNKLHLQCIYYNVWLIAYSVETNRILIEAILHKSRIVD
ncbi:hypothetical protein SAE01_07330 [Segetibacter aerophilus]|uniref:Plasmid stabilization protein n=1 Tax=Segetibacter aerophilus TaxID=670293 RepID=A0A512B8U3_9BACT|nr:hypothetical protein SAE01_07330 [Segetibacter aerophilus]